VLTFAVLVMPPETVMVLAQDPGWVALLEKEPGLAQRLAAGAFRVSGHQLIVTNTTTYSGGRVFTSASPWPTGRDTWVSLAARRTRSSRCWKLSGYCRGLEGGALSPLTRNDAKM